LVIPNCTPARRAAAFDATTLHSGAFPLINQRGAIGANTGIAAQ
jgi:hypothetical protein